MARKYNIQRAEDFYLRKQISESLNDVSDRVGGPDDGDPNTPPTYNEVATRWQKRWVQQQYYKGDQVVDDLWLCWANKTTNDRPAPQPIGAPVWTIPDVLTWTISPYTGIVFSGVRVTVPNDRLVVVNALRFWVQDAGDINANYQLVIYDNNLQDVIYAGNEFDGIVAETPQWVTISIVPEILFDGDDLTFLVAQRNSSATTNFNFPYVRLANNQNDNPPGAGNFSTNNQLTSFRIDDIDDNGVNRQTELSQIGTGTTIRIEDASDPTIFADITVLTNSHETPLNWYNMTTLPGDLGPNGQPVTGALCNIIITIPTPTPTNWVRLPDNYLNEPNLSGYLAFDDLESGSYNNDGHGVDVQFQEYLESDDWDIQALSSTQLPNVGTPQAFGPGVNIVDSSAINFWDRWLPVEKENLAKAMNRTSWQPGPPPTWDDVFRVQQFVAYTSERIILIWDPYVRQEVNWLESVGIIGPGRAAIILTP